jgi:hypothetical protein
MLNMAKSTSTKNKALQKLVELYESKEILWNVKNDDYHNKNKRQDALDKISREMGISGNP